MRFAENALILDDENTTNNKVLTRLCCIARLLEELEATPKLYKTGAGRLVVLRVENALKGQKDKTTKARLFEQAKKLGKGYMFKWFR